VGNAKSRPDLLDPTQVGQRDQQDDAETYRDAMFREPLELWDRDNGRDAGRHRNRTVSM